MDQNIGQAPSTKRPKRLAVKKINLKNKRSFSSLSKSSPTIQARVTMKHVLEFLKLYFINKLYKSPSSGLSRKCLSLTNNLFFYIYTYNVKQII